MNIKVLVARKERGITQEQLAERVGVIHTDIVRIEKHEWTPPSEIRQKLADALGLKETDLFDDVVLVRR